MKRVLPKVAIPETKHWLPAVVLVLCLTLFAMAVVTLLNVGADPKSGPAAVATSTAAQGFEGLKRLLSERGHYVVTNRFEDDGNPIGGSARHADIEIITLDNDGGVFNTRSQVHTRFDPPASASASASAEGEGAADEATGQKTAAAVKITASDEDAYGFMAPDKSRSDHLLKSPLGRAVIIVAPKWLSGTARTKPRWGADARLYPEPALRRTLNVLAPVTSVPSPSQDDEEEAGDAASGVIAEAWDQSGKAEQKRATRPAAPKAPLGKALFDDGDTLYTYDVVPYQIRRASGTGAVRLKGPAGQLDGGRISDLQSITGPNLVPVITGPNGEALVSRVVVTDGRAQPKVPVYLVSDPDLLNNQILADPKKVVTALALIDALSPVQTKTPSVVFNLTFNRLSIDRDILHALSRPPYLGVSLSVVLLGLGLVWASFARFGPPALAGEAAALGRGVRVLADNAARLMAIAVKETKLGPAYAQMIRDEVLKSRGHHQIDPNTSLDELADRIGRLYGATHSYSDLKARAANIPTVHQLIDYARQLHAWKTEIERANH